ncbi:Uncharacterised protein [Halioglobus japonicus]|nr:Uncharacterised protein [Halioglobus japonicus]
MTIGNLQVIVSRTRLLALWLACALSISAGATFSAVGTSVPISADLATGIATDIFPISLKLQQGNLFLTNPIVLFLDHGRVGIRVHFQAFDHRPDAGIAISETGQATVSGIPGYDAATRKILLGDPKIDSLEFDRSNEATRNFLRQINTAWSAQVANPLRAEIPPHPYMIPLRNNIQSLTYDGNNLIITLAYQ